MRESVAAAAKLPLAQAAEQEIAVLEQLLKQFPSAVHCLLHLQSHSVLAHPATLCSTAKYSRSEHPLKGAVQ